MDAHVTGPAFSDCAHPVPVVVTTPAGVAGVPAGVLVPAAKAEFMLASGTTGIKAARTTKLNNPARDCALPDE